MHHFGALAWCLKWLCRHGSSHQRACVHSLLQHKHEVFRGDLAHQDWLRGSSSSLAAGGGGGWHRWLQFHQTSASSTTAVRSCVNLTGHMTLQVLPLSTATPPVDSLNHRRGHWHLLMAFSFSFSRFRKKTSKVWSKLCGPRARRTEKKNISHFLQTLVSRKCRELASELMLHMGGVGGVWSCVWGVTFTLAPPSWPRGPMRPPWVV